jgi:uncharacterized protein (DUF1919 family)
LVKRTKLIQKKKKIPLKNNIAVVDEEYFSYKSVRELDSIQKHAPESENYPILVINRKVQIVLDNNKGDLFKIHRIIHP